MNRTDHAVYTEYQVGQTFWLDMLTQTSLVCFWKAVYLILFSIHYMINTLQCTLTIQCDKFYICWSFFTLSEIEMKKGPLEAQYQWDKEIKYIKFQAKRRLPFPLLSPIWSLPQLSLIWQKDPSQAPFLGLIVCDIHNTALVKWLSSCGWRVRCFTPVFYNSWMLSFFSWKYIS